MSTKLNSLPRGLIDRSKRDELLEFLVQQEIDLEVKIEIYSNWSKQLNQPIRNEDILFLKDEQAADDGGS